MNTLKSCKQMDKKYKIIYADPPWPYGRQQMSPENSIGYYPSMQIEDIKKLKITNISDKDSVLFLWATFPKLKEAIEVLESWGFKYITVAFVWVKQNPKNDKLYSGMGWWTNANAEIVLLGKKGKISPVAHNIKQILLEHRGRHSQKPKEIANRIVQLMGDLPRIELFARNKLDGWDTWGNECSKDIML